MTPPPQTEIKVDKNTFQLLILLSKVTSALQLLTFFEFTYPCPAHLIQVFPDPGKDTSALAGRNPLLVNCVRNFWQFVSFFQGWKVLAAESNRSYIFCLFTFVWTLWSGPWAKSNIKEIITNISINTLFITLLIIHSFFQGFIRQYQNLPHLISSFMEKIFVKISFIAPKCCFTNCKGKHTDRA